MSASTERRLQQEQQENEQRMARAQAFHQLHKELGAITWEVSQQSAGETLPLTEAITKVLSKEG